MGLKMLVMLIALLILVSGCTQSQTSSSTNLLVGEWETDTVFGSLTIEFKPNGTGSIKALGGNIAIDYRILDENTIEIDSDGKNKFTQIKYHLVNKDTLLWNYETSGQLTYIRK